jgi:hypothetical protein
MVVAVAVWALPPATGAAGQGARPPLLAPPDGRTSACDLAALRAHRPLTHTLVRPTACLGAALSPPGLIATYAGGLTGVVGPTTSFGMGPRGVALDDRGHLLIADGGNEVVWLANLTASAVSAFGQTVPAGSMAVVAGNDTYGQDSGDGGPAAQATLNGPEAVALDEAGDLFIADYSGDRIREVAASTGVITTVAGTGNHGCGPSASGPCYGGDGGPAIQAALNGPEAVALDGAGDLFIADSSNNRVREVVAATGVITTVAGNGSPQCVSPWSLNCFSGDGGPATQAALYTPAGVAVDGQGNLFIADSNNDRVREVVAATGVITTVAGGTCCSLGDGGPATQAALYTPAGVAVDGQGDLFIADSGNSRVREVVAATDVITTVAGDGTSRYGGDGGPATQAGLYGPQGLALDGAGDLFIADYVNNRVREVVAATDVITTVAGNGTSRYGGDGGPATQAGLYGPQGLAVDGAGDLFIADYFNNRIREVLAGTGIIATVAGDGSPQCDFLQGSNCFGGDGGPATQAALNGPSGVAVDGAGDLFIADRGNNRVREVVAATGVITTVAGTGSPGYGGDGGPATQAALSAFRVAVDGAGNVFIADGGHYRIREVLAATGVITTVAGTGTLGYSGDGGPATQAALYDLEGVAVDGAGDLFIADSDNERVRVVGLPPAAVLALSPASGIVWQTVSVTGANFAPAESVNLYWDSASASPLATTTAAANGTVAVSVTIPAAAAGTHHLIAIGQSSGQRATAPCVLAPSTLGAGPTSATPYQAVTVTGTNFGAAEAVKVYWDSTAASPLLTCTATTGGGFAATLGVPQAAAGAHTLIAVGQGSGRAASATLQVKPAVFLFPGGGKGGSAASLVGVGFGAGETMAGLWYPGMKVLGAATANTVGTAVLSFTVPLSATGTYYVVGYGLTSKLTAVAPFGVPALAHQGRSPAFVRELIARATAP